MKLPGVMVLLAAVLAAPARGQDPWSAAPPPWEGVWRGTIGSLPVHVCLNNTPYVENGAYYYDPIRALIRLERDGGGWVEQDIGSKPGARWSVDFNGDGTLTGNWNHGRRTLPVRLQRIRGPNQDFDGPCGTMTFHRPRLGRMVTTEEQGTKNGAAVTTWTFKPGAPFEDVEISTFTLDRAGSGVDKVNAMLRAILPGSDGGGAWLQCMMSNANAHGADGDYSESITPTLVSERWLAVMHSVDDSCGGAHPNTSNRPRSFDLSGGREVDPLDWFTANAVVIETFDSADAVAKTLTGEFRSFILAGYKPDEPDCEGAIEAQEYWQVGIARGALVFSPDLPRVAMACGLDFRVPIDRLQPWLNAEGKAAVATLPR